MGIKLEIEDRVATVTIDRPPVNALRVVDLDHIAEVFAGFRDRRDVRCAILTGAGERSFIAGADLSDGAVAEPPASTVVDPGQSGRRALWAVYDCAVPVIAAVNGYAAGGGLAFAAMCDLIVASESATFFTPEIDVGLLGGFTQLSLLVSRHVARELYLTGDRIGAVELRQLGAIRHVVAPDELLPTARRLAGAIAAKSPIAVWLAKEGMNRAEGPGLQDAYRREQDLTERLARHDDAAEARAARADKRTPRWSWD